MAPEQPGRPLTRPAALRLFVADELPDAQRQAVSELVAPLRGSLAGLARFGAEAGWHVTLKFLGRVAESRLGEVCAIAAAAAAGGAPAAVSLAGLGAFPSPRRARVVWVGLDDPSGAIAALAASLEAGFRAAGFPAEERPWRPHLTVARLPQPRAVPLPPPPGGLPGEFTVAEAVLFQSHLRPRGAVYEVLDRYPLGSR